MIQQKAADASIWAAVLVWFMSHLTEINAVLQFFLLIGSLVGVFFAIRYHKRNTPRNSPPGAPPSL
ncbi:MAG TPA: hypothetical protein VFB37_00920 [Steroidobacteraceae bacterium]|nr:hypothetical protein [Steroidobacteraceae bacterium]